MKRNGKSNQEKYDEVMRGAKITYFTDLLSPFVQDAILDSAKLKTENPKLYEEFRQAFKGIRKGCKELNINPSRGALKARLSSTGKVARILALAYIAEHGMEATAEKLGVSVEMATDIQFHLEHPPVREGRPKGSKNKKQKDAPAPSSPVAETQVAVASEESKQTELPQMQAVASNASEKKEGKKSTSKKK